MEEETDITIALAVSGVSGVIIGICLGKYWRRKKMQKKLNTHLEKVRTISVLQAELTQWMAENVGTMSHDEYFARLREKTQFLCLVTEQG